MKIALFIPLFLIFASCQTLPPIGRHLGDAVDVKWKSKWWAAHVIQIEQDRWKIHYDQYSNRWDEWVGPKRIRPRTIELSTTTEVFKAGIPVEVLWRESWYPAVVTKIGQHKQRWFVHYSGERGDYDEWVEADRIRRLRW